MKNVLWWLAPFSAGCKTVFNSFPVLGSDIIYRALNGIAVFLSGANTNRKRNFICFASHDCFYHSSKFGKTRETEKKWWEKQRGEFAPEMFFTAMVSISILNHSGLDGQAWVLCGFSSGIVGTEIFATGTCQEDSFVKDSTWQLKELWQWKGCLMKFETIETNPEIRIFCLVESFSARWFRVFLDEAMTFQVWWRCDESMEDFE